MDRDLTVQDENINKYMTRLRLEKFLVKSGREVMEDMTSIMEGLVVRKVTDRPDRDMDKYKEEGVEMENFVI